MQTRHGPVDAGPAAAWMQRATVPGPPTFPDEALGDGGGTAALPSRHSVVCADPAFHRLPAGNRCECCGLGGECARSNNECPRTRRSVHRNENFPGQPPPFPPAPYLAKHPQAFDQLTVNEYLAGVGLSPHIDTHSAFGDVILSLSLGGPAVMVFRRRDRADVALALPQRSLLILSGEARHAW